MVGEVMLFDPPRPYARAIRVGPLVFLCGHVGDLPDGSPVAGGIEEQSEALMKNLITTLAHFDLGCEHIVRTTTYLLRKDDLAAFRTVRKRHITRPVPGTTVVVKELLDGFRVEMDAMAIVLEAPTSSASPAIGHLGTGVRHGA
jgi:2-iminobutanoate/2-iminopropanoate deaminase